MSGNCWIFIALNEAMPTSVSTMNSSTAGSGLRIDQAETLTAMAASYFFAAAAAAGSTTRTRSPSARKPTPLSTTRD